MVGMIKIVKELCDDLYEIGEIKGKHLEGWKDEFNREETCNEFIMSVIEYAHKYDIEYDDNLESYRSEDWEEIENLQDVMGCELVDKIREKIYGKILVS